MIKVMMAAPFEANGRFQGGINAVVNSILEAQDAINKEKMEIIPFNTCRIDRNNSDGKINWENIHNFGLVYRDSVNELRKYNPDVFYMHSSRNIALLKDILVLRHVKKRIGCKTVLHIHFADIKEILSGKEMLDSWMLSAMKKFVDGLVFLSAKTLEQFVEQGIPRDKCHVIYNFSTLSYEEQELFSDKERDCMAFLFAGSIDSRKGIFDALDVLAGVDEPYRIHICGGFRNIENEERFRAYLEKLGEKLQFHGFIKGDQKRELFRESDVLLLPSYGEGLPVVILEAFSAGCGVVTTDVGAIAEIVKPENGIIIPPGNQQELKKAILTYLHMNKSVLRKQKKENFKLGEQYTLDEFIRKISDVCRCL